MYIVFYFMTVRKNKEISLDLLFLDSHGISSDALNISQS